MYIDKLGEIVNSTIKMKPVDVKPITYIVSSKEINYQDPKFKIGDIVKISKYKKVFGMGYVPNWSEEVFGIKKVQNTVPWAHFIIDLKYEEIVGAFYEKELQKTNQNEFGFEKVIKKKGVKLYVKWKGYDSSFNSLTDKKDIFI